MLFLAIIILTVMTIKKDKKENFVFTHIPDGWAYILIPAIIGGTFWLGGFITSLKDSQQLYVKNSTIDSLKQHPIHYAVPLYYNADDSVILDSGKQIWASKNLDVDTFQDGTPIYQIKYSYDWKKMRDELREACKEHKPAWCYYMDSIPYKNKIDSIEAAFHYKKYGKLYNWYAVNDKKHGGIAPKGWHVSTAEDWFNLEKIVGINKVDELKSKTGWIDGNGNNKSGLNMFPNGIVSGSEISGCFCPQNRGIGTAFWTSEEANRHNRRAIAFAILENSLLIQEKNDCPEGFLYSVRCVRNNK